ncbi:hypothetical protein [uncultured Tyzzerella sp.]|uniref:hypothetical protein n=1 Tax=uncultured Tyzzerella sp. TaxID=2321398 RepID=UPI0029420A60|nr:hypothetical protein [uncultured Tyzzerella sp.]
MDNFVTDYVYFDEEVQEFKNVHIKINVVKDDFVINISSEEILKDGDVLVILKQLENNLTKKLRISLVEECEIFITDKEGTRKIELEYGGFFIKKTIKQS